MHDFVDQALARRRLTRRIQLRAPVPIRGAHLGASDMVSVLQRRIAEELGRYRPLVISLAATSIANIGNGQ